jgi:uncharacterized protein DUF1707
VARVPALRASDSDREQVAERLRVAAGEGRLSTDELEDRLGALYAARTYGELDVLVEDLPASSAPGPVRTRVPGWAAAAAAITVLLAVLSMLASARHAADVAAFRAAARHGQFPGLFPGPHHSFDGAPPLFGLVAVVAVCVALGWLVVQSRPSTDG